MGGGFVKRRARSVAGSEGPAGPGLRGLDRAELVRLQSRRLSALLDAIRADNAFYAGRLPTDLPGLGPEPDLPAAIRSIPLTTRADIERDQREHPPYGSNLTYPLERYTRMHQTSGSTGTPVRWLDTPESWTWWKRCWDTVYAAAGVTSADRLVFPFSFGPFIGFWSAFEAAVDRGCLVLPAGGMSTSARLRYILDNRVTVVCCTPTYALHMADTAGRERIDLGGGGVRLLIVAGEPGGGVPATRARIETAWGARLIDHAGMTEVGAWGFEPIEAPAVMHVNEAEFIAEVIDPQTLQPVPDGEQGELVLTNLGRLGSPLIRYRTGDLVRLTRAAPGERDGARETPWWSACARLAGGILGRADELLFVRGNNVFPAAIEGILRTFEQVVEFRLAVERANGLSDLLIEIEPRAETTGRAADTLAGAVTAAIRDRLHFRPIVRVVPVGTLPRFEMKARRVQR